MSVGGRVVDVVPVSPDKVWVNTDDNPNLTHGSLPNLCAVYCDPQGHEIRVGDSLWWQGMECYWTPKDRPFGAFDIPLPKIGFSGVSRPLTPTPPPDQRSRSREMKSIKVPKAKPRKKKPIKVAPLPAGQTAYDAFRTAMSTMPDEALSWLMARLHQQQLWPDGLGGFRPDSARSIEAAMLAVRQLVTTP